MEEVLHESYAIVCPRAVHTSECGRINKQGRIAVDRDINEVELPLCPSEGIAL